MRYSIYIYIYIYIFFFILVPVLGIGARIMECFFLTDLIVDIRLIIGFSPVRICLYEKITYNLQCMKGNVHTESKPYDQNSVHK